MDWFLVLQILLMAIGFGLLIWWGIRMRRNNK